MFTTTVADTRSVWHPSPQRIQQANITDLQQQLGFNDYAALHQWSVTHRGDFWHRMIQRLGLRFQHPYRSIVDLSDGVEHPHWLVDAQFNIVDSCFLAPKDHTAVLFQPPDEPMQRWSYGDLEQLTDRVAHGLVAAGYQQGDAIAIILPMTVTAVAIYLGIIKMGGVVVAIAESFAPGEMATRLTLAQTKLVFTQSTLQRQGKRLPLYDKVIAANAPPAIVLEAVDTLGDESKNSRDLRCGDRSWSEFLGPPESFAAVPCQPDTPLNILFSSGTTGIPKAIPWPHTTPIKCAVDSHLHHDLHPADVVAWPTSLGWMMGPWLIFASLLNRATIALYGDTPGDRGFGEFVQQAQVTMLGVVPTLVSAWRRKETMTGLDWHSIKTFSSTGECSNPEDMAFLMALAGQKPIIEYCGGTEIGGGYMTGTVVQPNLPSQFSTPALGLDLVILDDNGQPSDEGEAFLVPPSIGLSTTLLNRDHHQVYFADTPVYPFSLRRHGDRFQRLANGYYRAQGRVDDTMNLSGIKVSAVEIERVLQPLSEVQEVAAIAVSANGPSHLVVCVVLTSAAKGEALTPEDLRTRFQQTIRQTLNPLFHLQEVVILDALPRTASNKVMRRQLRNLKRGMEVQS